MWLTVYGHTATSTEMTEQLSNRRNEGSRNPGGLLCVAPPLALIRPFGSLPTAFNLCWRHQASTRLKLDCSEFAG
jgi:hypothetical protein